MDKESKEWLRFNSSSLNTNEFEQYSGWMKTLNDKIQELYDNELPSSVPNTPIPNEHRRGGEGEQASNIVYYNLDLTKQPVSRNPFKDITARYPTARQETEDHQTQLQQQQPDVGSTSTLENGRGSGGGYGPHMASALSKRRVPTEDLENQWAEAATELKRLRLNDQ
jgi:hypothetical protein